MNFEKVDDDSTFGGSPDQGSGNDPWKQGSSLPNSWVGDDCPPKSEIQEILPSSTFLGEFECDINRFVLVDEFIPEQSFKDQFPLFSEEEIALLHNAETDEELTRVCKEIILAKQELWKAEFEKGGRNIHDKYPDIELFDSLLVDDSHRIPENLKKTEDIVKHESQ